MSRLLIFEGAAGAPDNTLILRLKFDDNSGAGGAITDSSGNGNHFSLGTGDGTWVTGKSGSGYALSFDGTNDSASSDAPINFGTDVITVLAWVKWDTFANDNGLLMELSADSNTNDGTFIINPNASVAADFEGGLQDGVTGSRFRSEYATRPTAGSWKHYAFVLDNSTTTGDVKIFFDGIEQSTTIRLDAKDKTGNFLTDTLYLFSRAGTTLFGGGDIDDLRIYAGELTVSEIEYVRDNPDE